MSRMRSKSFRNALATQIEVLCRCKHGLRTPISINTNKRSAWRIVLVDYYSLIATSTYAGCVLYSLDLYPIYTISSLPYYYTSTTIATATTSTIVTVILYLLLSINNYIRPTSR